ncbi:hypothetical protein RO3G_15906 [Rhizopus delemar RA 99-880]|uniref:Uncharacterized protein n=1 Tax=Rhizopus delemar (strain RA 99-880 / ATCC MYA-4621 / FGSC 9543 / NRRL 43880) TaxID=246409 RepID=I1CRW5_RHIO9|nr:hypothetical protein RO3G_15906 [Rhizopus delemar RA 99-880]|eukprot:EIE91195.1 hypothetical protein RO3G_15906 [Rhizopus delemar RA 99-880]
MFGTAYCTINSPVVQPCTIFFRQSLPTWFVRSVPQPLKAPPILFTHAITNIQYGNISGTHISTLHLVNQLFTAQSFRSICQQSNPSTKIHPHFSSLPAPYLQFGLLTDPSPSLILALLFLMLSS